MRNSTRDSRRLKKADTMRKEYHIDYRRSRANRFAKKMTADSVAVVLDRDVASVFDSAEAVNSFLRAAIRAMSSGAKDTKRRRLA